MNGCRAAITHLYAFAVFKAEGIVLFTRGNGMAPDWNVLRPSVSITDTSPIAFYIGAPGEAAVWDL
jgi:hypothetical protein